MDERYWVWLEKVTTIKAGVIGTALSGGWGVIKGVDWLTVLGAVVAILTAIAQGVRIWTDVREERRRAHRHAEKNQGTSKP